MKMERFDVILDIFGCGLRLSEVLERLRITLLRVKVNEF